MSDLPRTPTAPGLIDGKPDHCPPPAPRAAPAATQSVVDAARKQLDAAASDLDEFVTRWGIMDAAAAQRITSARVELAGAYTQHVYAVNAAIHQHPF